MQLRSIRGAIAFWVVALGVIEGGLGPVAVAQTNPNLKMGKPSQARSDVDQMNNYLLDRPEYVSSYDNDKGTPNWVSWRLAKEDLGTAPRDNFYADPFLPASFKRVEPSEYTGSGFDRGHICPHGDRTGSTASSTATFAMTNIVPQSHDVNTMAWESLENYCRDLVHRQAKVCYIIAGPAGQGGTGKLGFKTATPDGKVVVPTKNWKVVMVLDGDVAAARDLTTSSKIRLIAVIMPNADGAVGEDWTPFRTTVNAVQTLTGYTFFGDVDPAVINQLEGQVDSVPVAAEVAQVRGQSGPLRAAPGSKPPTPANSGQESMPLDPVTLALTKSCQGLTYPSEADEPVLPFYWGKIDGALPDEKLRTLAHQDPQARVERVEVASFFQRLTEPRHVRSQVSTQDAQRYAILLQTLRTQLTDLQVVKFGQSDVVIFVLGRTRDGKIMGVTMNATET